LLALLSSSPLLKQQHFAPLLLIKNAIKNFKTNFREKRKLIKLMQQNFTNEMPERPLVDRNEVVDVCKILHKFINHSSFAFKVNESREFRD